ncbi:MAG: aliphatic sulfonate ABC transporter substrate-binding protein [Clostridiales bacterium]|nr:aliphatic sulfonate ABC transporter substrate-binding protein [Clostridiales bacterium]
MIAAVSVAALCLQLVACGGAAEETVEDTFDSTETEESATKTGEEEVSETDYDGVVIRLAVQKATYVVHLANALGYFENEFAEDGITVELDEFSLGPAIVEAINSDEVDFGFIGDLPAFSGLVNDGEYKIVGKYSDDYNGGLLVRDDSGIESLADLEGKKVAVPLGSTQQVLLEIYLEEAGLSDDDIDLVNLGFADINTSLLNGDIDAAVTGEPQLSQALNNGGVTKLLGSEGYKAFVNPIIATDDFLETYPELTARLLSVLQRAGEWAKENTDEAIELIAEATDASVDDIAPKLEAEGCDITAELTDDEIQALIKGAEDCYKYGLITDELNVEDYIDTSYLEQAGIQ